MLGIIIPVAAVLALILTMLDNRSNKSEMKYGRNKGSSSKWKINLRKD